MAGFSLYVSNTTSKNQGHLCYKDNTMGNPSVDLSNIICPIFGRYVIYYNVRGTQPPYYLSKNAYNELCELEVYGKFIYYIRQ